MDYDNDGILDFISGSYDPGDLYLFRGEGEGKYAKVQKILDKSGLPVVHHPEEFAKYERMKDDPAADEQESITARVASFGSWVAPVDWEAAMESKRSENGSDPLD
ncbi:MAG: VCBS repeat-containing protein [Pirellulales bacterium]